jgi:hypothetical protein
MARSEVSGTTTGRRIVQNAKFRASGGNTDIDDAAERLLSRKTRAASGVRRNRKRRSGPTTLALALFKIVIATGVVVGGISVIIWLRDFGAASGINWIGD